MQILDIVLYSRNGERRVLSFETGKINIITGGSATGKSALIDIVDYCLGRESCPVPEGVIRDTVKWFGLRVQFLSGQVFIGRKNPVNSITSSEAYLQQGDNVEIPLDMPTEGNTTADAIEKYLSQKLGISANRFTPGLGQTRLPLTANIRHTLYYCFQQQSEIASKDILFHRQSDGFLATSMRDSLPYFLGAVEEDRLALEQELAFARRELKRAQQALREAESIRGEGTSKGIALLTEAREIGLVGEFSPPEDVRQLAVILQEVARWTPNEITYPSVDQLSAIQDELTNFRKALIEIEDRIQAAKIFSLEAHGFSSEVVEQQNRLESIELFPNSSESRNQCPVCSQSIEGIIPQANVIKEALLQLRSNLETTTRELPRLREHINGLEENREKLRRKIVEKSEQLEAIFQERDNARVLRDINLRRGRVIGRISLWLESVSLSDDLALLRNRIQTSQLQVQTLEQQLDPVEKQTRLLSILNRIGAKMTEWSTELGLEHTGNPVRLDLSALTVVIDRPDRPIPLNRMGSGENWVGYHLITYLALHQHFITQNRPVPRFIFFDQPSQVYYPREHDTELQGSLASLTDEDRFAVRRLFDFLFRINESLGSSLQIIITDHADLAEEKFQLAIRERWREGNALIPAHWYQ